MQLTDVGRLNPDTLLNVRSVWVIRDLVRQDLGLAEGVHKGRTASSRGTCNTLRKTTGQQTPNTSRNNTWEERLTNDHQGELDTLLDLVSSASAGERHLVRSLSFGLLHLRAEQSRDEGES
jgi:hypothetical protein